jgi:predicted phosphodiesterase
MKLLVLSDLHLELGTSLTLTPGLEYDVVVLAGDIHSPGRKAVRWAQRESTFSGKPVVLVAGNHEFYGCEMGTELAEMRKAAEGSNVHLLERGSTVIGGVRFLGCMLWTDFQLPVRQPDGSTETNVGLALAEANRCMNDFRLIELQAPAKSQHRARKFRRLLQAEDTLAMNWVDRDWLRRELAKPFDGPTVVVTHHAPATGSVAERYAADWLTPAFVSHLPGSFFEVPAVWIHGHTHSPFDYQRGGCRIVSNPRGYRTRDGSFENHQFNAGFVVEVSVDSRLTPTERGALRDQYAPYGFEHYDELLREGRRLRSERLEAADMVAVAEAAGIVGQSAENVEAAVARGDYLGMADEARLLRLPKWQFEPAYTGIWKRLAEALGTTDAWDLLTALETPLGALGGITPRAAIERGQAERVLEVIGSD